MKKKSIIMLFIVILLSIACFTSIVYSEEFIYGDVDGSGRVNSSDYALVKRYVLGIQDSFSYEYGEKAADVSGDGLIDSNDYALLIRYVLEIISEFPHRHSQSLHQRHHLHQRKREMLHIQL